MEILCVNTVYNSTIENPNVILDNNVHA